MTQCLKRMLSVLLVILLLVEALLPQTANAQQSVKGVVGDPISFHFNMLNYDTTAYIRAPYWDDFPQERKLSYTCANRTKEPVSLKIESSNTNVVKILSQTKTEQTLKAWGVINSGIIYYDVVGVGIADIVATIGDKVYKKRVYSVAADTEITKITQTGYRSVTIEWKKVPGSSGYRVERKAVTIDNEYQSVTTLYGDDQTSVTVSGEFGGFYKYRVISFVQDDKRTVEANIGYHSAGIDFSLLKIGAEITDVETSGSNMIVKWDAMDGALCYKLYRSEMENATGNCICTIENNSQNFTYQDTVTKGKTYYYKLITVYPEGESDVSATVAQYIPGNGKKRSVQCKKFSQSGYWPTDRSSAYYYQMGGELHVVRVHQDKSKIKDYTMDSAMKVKSTKTVKLDSFDEWGGFYRGIDGNFYVVIGYDNLKESKTKTVIKVIQYSSKWKKMKTANIKGGVEFTFLGITIPFDAGNCQMDMHGTTLYLMTAREMFTTSDGLRHQSSIGFEIDTKNMKAKTSGHYVSHSFNQFIKWKDHSLYELNHGDAYPRALDLDITSEYVMYGDAPPILYLFPFKGTLGDNFTGCEVGSMEVGRKNVLVCSKSQPHNYTVKGVTGFGTKLKYNVCLILADRKTGEVNVQWLTNYNPKTSTISVGTPQMVKLSDERFAVLYTTTTKKDKTTLHYVVVNDAGKKIYSKTYSNMELTDESQPILYNGSIVWTETSYTNNTTLYSVPAVYK